MDKLKIWLPLVVFVLPIIGGWYTLQANTKNLEKRVDKAEEKVEILKESADKMDVKQEAIKDKVEDTSEKIDKIMDLLIKLNEKESVRRPR
jgi:uncharacterized protein YoxC